MIVFRENDLSKDEFDWLIKKKNLQLVSIENLHAKCYVNEERALLSSMNLYEYSQINNHELSVLFSAKEDADSYYTLNTRISKILKSKNETLDMGYLFRFGPYQMKHLYLELDSTYYFSKKSNGRDATYRFICEEAKKIIDFQEDDFYEDGSAILRNTLLGKEKFDLLYNTISRLGTPKKRKKMID